MTTVPAPIALFAYRRADHLRRTLDALSRNAEASASDLVIFSDGPKNAQAEADVRAVRALVRDVSGFRSVRVVERPANWGLARSIISGVSEMLEQRDRVIVMEDDIVTAPHFLRYMNDALEAYADDERVISAHGYVYPVGRALPETFFIRGADCWGWATWRRGWKLFNPDGGALLAQLRDRHLEREFDFDGTFAYTSMLEKQIAGTNDSWAVRWYASAFLAGKLTLYPGRSLVHNIGNDSSGVHSADTVSYDVTLSDRPLRVGGIPVTESTEGRVAFIEFGSRAHRPVNIMGRVRGLMRRILGRA